MGGADTADVGFPPLIALPPELEQLLEGAGGVDRREVLAMDVLDEGELEQLVALSEQLFEANDASLTLFDVVPAADHDEALTQADSA